MSGPDLCRHHFSWNYLICAVCHHNAFGRTPMPATERAPLTTGERRSE